MDIHEAFKAMTNATQELIRPWRLIAILSLSVSVVLTLCLIMKGTEK